MLFRHAGEQVENVFHVGFNETPITAETLNALADVFIAWETSDAKANRSNQTALEGVRVTDLSAIDGLQVQKNPVPSIVGTADTPAMPGNVTWAVKLQTTRGTRGSQGRTFWIGLVESQCLNNTIVTAAGDNILLALNNLMDDIDTGTVSGRLVVLHSMQGGLLLNPRTRTDVSQAIARDYILDSQKSRLPGKRRKSSS
jgi:hypothetical protein